MFVRSLGWRIAALIILLGIGVLIDKITPRPKPITVTAVASYNQPLEPSPTPSLNAIPKANVAPGHVLPSKTNHPKLEPSTPSTERNPLEMYFTNPENVEWNIKNSSNAAISDILYWFMLVDLDQPNLFPSSIARSAPVNPLPITVQKIEFINAGETGGAIVLPTNLMNRINVGDRIFGTASFSYPNGAEKDYWLYFRFRGGGWYAPTTKKSMMQTGIPVSEVARDTNGTLDSLVPKQTRVEIRKVD